MNVYVISNKKNQLVSLTYWAQVARIAGIKDPKIDQEMTLDRKFLFPEDLVAFLKNYGIKFNYIGDGMTATVIISQNGREMGYILNGKWDKKQSAPCPAPCSVPDQSEQEREQTLLLRRNYDNAKERVINGLSFIEHAICSIGLDDLFSEDDYFWTTVPTEDIPAYAQEMNDKLVRLSMSYNLIADQLKSIHKDVENLINDGTVIAPSVDQVIAPAQKQAELF